MAFQPFLEACSIRDALTLRGRLFPRPLSLYSLIEPDSLPRRSFHVPTKQRIPPLRQLRIRFRPDQNRQRRQAPMAKLKQS